MGLMGRRDNDYMNRILNEDVPRLRRRVLVALPLAAVMFESLCR